MTAYALKGDMERCLEKGASDYLAKPVNRQLLMQTLLKWLPKSCEGNASESNSREGDAQKPRKALSDIRGWSRSSRASEQHQWCR